MKRRPLYFAILAATASLSHPILAQENEGADPTVEEIVVTGSFIKRDKFDMASPVESIDAVDIQTSGYTSIGPYIRDLTYTANVDTVANVLSVADGQQDSNSARFNLRGLGTSSTLTLMDGRRVLNSGAVAGIIPDIALDRVEVILDGGAATYGTDAVAGVVNLIPIQRFDGAKVRGFYTQDSEGDIYEPKVSLLFGRSFDRLDVVAAIDYSERKDALHRSDRPDYLRADNDTSISGNPGSYSVAATGGFGGVDPGCGTGNAGREDDGLAGSYPGGLPTDLGTGLPIALACTMEYGQFQDYKRPYEDLVTYLTASYELNDSVTLRGFLNYNDRTSVLVSTPSTAERGSNDLLNISPVHPNSPFPYTVTPRNWRPFSANGATQPSFMDDRGSLNTPWNYVTTSLALGTEFDMGSGWTGEAWATRANSSTTIKNTWLNLDRLSMALRGEGGPDGDQWFNPFYSASVHSPDYVPCETGTGAGCTANDQTLVNWLYHSDEYEASETEYWSVEGFVTGDLFELPAGAVQVAVGAQFRETEYMIQGNPLARTASEIYTNAAADGGPASQDYNSAVNNGVSGRSVTESAVSSLFTEFLVPIADELEMTLAMRYEDFRDLGMSATVPKVSFRYQPLDNLSLRASVGEGFLAPTVSEVTIDDNPQCSELFSGTDPVTGGDLANALSCSNGNPDLDPEESEIFNLGATWKATDNLEFSLDYQQIDYSDRIIRLSSTDTLNMDFANMLQENGLNQGDWSNLSDPDQLAVLQSWHSSPEADSGIIRDPATGDVLQVIREPNNITAVEVDVIDFRIRHGMDMGRWGYLSTNWSTTAYAKYEYQDAWGARADAAGKQNGDSDIAPPLPEMKHQLRFGWLLDRHHVGLTFNYQDEVEFDSSVGPAYGPGLGASVPETINAQTIVDLRYAVNFDQLAGGRVEFALGANNLLDERPQRLPILGGLETRLQDPTGRMLYIEGTYSFE
ncbi:TonB-dependent receptor plug domain-containing protein [Gilvimarinus sp. F26214L]|uniref:TonB-dependent receptor plug domain-containing protein n=1 Tax=Gilvimarinus sp. DZF01 TaxID=3461371 RepID=UPI004045ECBE